MPLDAAIVGGFYAKSVTAPIAMGVVERINVSPTLTAVFAVTTGILGAILVRFVLDAVGSKAWWQRGFALGVAAHGIGTGTLDSRSSPAAYWYSIPYAAQIKVRFYHDNPGAALHYLYIDYLALWEIFRAPAFGTVVLEGQLPTALQAHQAAPGVGEIVLSGLAPVATASVQVPAGAVVLEGLAPAAVLALQAAPDAGVLLLDGLTPSVAGVGQITPDAGVVLVEGYAPDRQENSRRLPDPGAVVFTGQAPASTEASRRLPDPGTVVLEGLAPAGSGVGTISVPAGEVLLAGAAPQAQEAALRTPDAEEHERRVTATRAAERAQRCRLCQIAVSIRTG